MSQSSYGEEQTCQLNDLDGVFPLCQHFEINMGKTVIKLSQIASYALLFGTNSCVF